MTSATHGALTGIRVLDFSRVLAGPFCTMLLGDMGADVIKVENPRGGDDTRQWGPPWIGTGDDALSAYYVSVNRNKRSMTLNLKSPQGQDIARQLAVESHILIENFKPEQMAGYGLDYAALHEINPALVYCSITGFGQDGPYHERPGYDYVIQAMSGLMSITGPADGTPHKVGVAISDVVTGLDCCNRYSRRIASQPANRSRAVHRHRAARLATGCTRQYRQQLSRLRSNTTTHGQ